MEKDVDFRELAIEELESLEKQKQTLEEQIKMMLVPKDPNDSKNIILESRAGAGGDEAAIFAGDFLGCTNALQKRCTGHCMFLI